jgi:hypothetical protein
MISLPNVMLTVLCKTEGLHVVDVPPTEATFAIDSYCQDVVSEVFRAYPVGSNRQLVVHADNARPHTSKRTIELMEKNNLRGAPHPAFSPDLAHSDFLLFGCIIGKLQGAEFTEKDDLLAEIREILNGI